MDPLRATVERALGAQYDVLRLIGRGGMGAVYLARERLLERLVAVKVLPHDAAATGGGRERFLREARTAARLSHPHIVPLHSFAEGDGTFLYVMGYVDGESLESRLAREVRLPPDAARAIIAEIADALDYAHKQGVVHRDVKPDNILIESATGRAFLTDFGVAKHSTADTGHTLTQTGMIVGTPHYMSPEQASADRDVDGRSDLYALGVIGYRLLTGRLPFEGRSLQELLAQHAARDPVPVSVVVADLPPDLVHVVSKCLRKDPAERWVSGAHLRGALASGNDIMLPDEIADLPSRGTKAVGIGLIGVLATLGLYRLDNDTTWLAFIAVTMGLGVVAFGADWIVRARRHGIWGRRFLKMLFWAPERWSGWWPKSLRRPGDIWPLLPRWLRRIKAGSTLLIAAGVTTGLLTLLTMHPLMADAMFALSAGMFAGLFGLTVVQRRVMKRYGFTKLEFGKILEEPTWKGALWQRPDVARILEQPEPRVTGIQPRTPDECARAIEQIADAMTGPVSALARESADAAREVAQLVAHIDAELAELSRDADPAERARLDQKLGSLGAPMPDEPAARRQMRELVLGQLRLFDELEARRRRLADDRERHSALLRTLWLQVASLRAQAAQGSDSVAAISVRIRALCDDASAHRAARAEVSGLVGGATPSGSPVA